MKSSPPSLRPELSQGEIGALLGKKMYLYERLHSFLIESYQPALSFKFSKKDGWTVFYRKSGKALCYMNFRTGGFTVTVVVGASLAVQVAGAGLSAETNEMYRNAYQFHDGRWLLFDVVSEDQLADIMRLIIVKKKPKAGVLERCS